MSGAEPAHGPGHPYFNAEEAAERFGVTVEDMEAQSAIEQIEDLNAAMEDLQKAYDAAYESALSSIQGQGSLLEGLSLDADRTKLTLTDGLNSLKEMESYWSTYNSNLQMLQGYGLSTDFLSRYCDASADGVANTQDLADRLSSLNETDRTKWVEDYNTAMEELTEAQGDAATSVADLETDYTEAAAKIQQAIAETAQNAVSDMQTMATDMNQSGTAWVSGNATGSAYRQALSAQLKKAIAETQSAKAQISNALGSGSGTKTDWSQYNYGVPGRAAGGFTAGPTLAGEDPNHPVEAVISFDPKYHEENVGYLQQAAAMLGVTAGQMPQSDAGYSFGGFTPYGEMLLRKIRAMETNPETATAPVYMPQGSGTTAVIQNSNSITVTPGMTRQEVLDMLNANNESIVDMVFEAQERAERDRRRTSYGC